MKFKHIFEIKDFEATKESAKQIASEIEVILGAEADIEIDHINIFINDCEVKNLHDYYGPKANITKIPIYFIPTLHKLKKKKNVARQRFATFHNNVINELSADLAIENAILHIIEGTLDLTDMTSENTNYKTRLGEMIHDVVDMMTLLDYPVWFNTASDKGNMKFGHYFTMIDLLNLDQEYPLKSIPQCIMYSGNSNLDWIMIDTNSYKKNEMPLLMMNSTYDYDFLSIKELIAKFANYGHGYFDNMFPTIPTEVGAYFRNPQFDRDLKNYDMSKYKENIKLYQENLVEYKNLKPGTINDVLTYVRSVLLNKLSEGDKIILQHFSKKLIA